jgi:predicted AlkP superfamily pyrophosphatase or phosphodiesterase
MTLPLCLALLAPPPVVPPAPPRPKLIVVFTVDQLRADYLERWKSQLSGGLFQLISEGAVFADGHQDHAVAETAPGHATVLSGRWPAHTGIVRNLQGVQDSMAPLVGAAGAGASPRRFRGTAFLDWLRAVDPGARALSVSAKDRGAILPMGTARAAVYWLSFQTGQFTTSRYYADSLPLWVKMFNAKARPPGAWALLLADSAYHEDDDEPWENGGRNRTFPHAIPAACAAAPTVACAATPALDSTTLELAWAGVEALRLGRRGGGTDLLAVSLSSTDYIGHAFGPDSREIHDQVLRLDRALGWFLKRLLDRVGRDNVVVVLTADHGVTSFPERTRAKTGAQAYRVSLDTLVAAVNRDLDRLVGGGGAPRDWLAFESGMLFLQDNGRFTATGVKTDSLLDAVAARMRAVPGVGRVDGLADLARADTASDPVARRWLHQLPGDAGVVRVVTLQPGSVWGSEAPLAMHGQPTEDDTHVPIVFWGRAVKRGIYRGRVNTVDIAPTLGRLLGLTPLSLIDGHALTDALAPKN